MEKRNFGDKIRKMRLIRRITLRKFAEEMGISAAYLSHIERNKLLPSEKIISKMGQALGFNQDELLSWAGKISSDILEIIVTRPIIADYIRKVVANMSDEELKNCIKNNTHF